MKISEAIELIKDAPFNREHRSTWADLGCGNGLFTRALAGLLAEGSQVYAVDKIYHFMPPSGRGNATIDFIHDDFENEMTLPSPIHGVLMANSLHFVRDKNFFLQKLITVNPGLSTLIIIEYEILRSNPWVPYPIGFRDLKVLLEDSGFTGIRKLSERKSVYQRGNIYACSAEKL